MPRNHFINSKSSKVKCNEIRRKFPKNDKEYLSQTKNKIALNTEITTAFQVSKEENIVNMGQRVNQHNKIKIHYINIKKKKKLFSFEDNSIDHLNNQLELLVHQAK